MIQWNNWVILGTISVVIISFSTSTECFHSSSFSVKHHMKSKRCHFNHQLCVLQSDVDFDVKGFRGRRKDVLSDHDEVDILRRTLDTLDYPSILSYLAAQCQTQAAKDIILSSPNNISSAEGCDEDESDFDYPLTAPNYQGVLDRFNALKEYDELCRLNLKAPSLSSDLNIRHILKSTEKGSILECDDIREIARALKSISLIFNWLREVGEQNLEGNNQGKFIHLPRLGKNIYVDEDLRHLLEKAFDVEGQLSSSTFPELGKLRKEVAIMRKQILSKVESMLKSSQVTSMLEGNYFSEINGRFVLPVQATHKNTVGIVHDSSRTGKTVYVEPKEVVEPTNEMKQKELMLKQEETRILRSLTSKIMKNREDIEVSINGVAQIDLILAKTRFQSIIQGVIPEVGNEGVIDVYSARHPVLVLKGNDVVPNDISLGVGDNKGMILSGPNSGGKTINLKLFGVLALLCRDAIPLPISSGRVDFFSPVLADIGDMQNVNEDLSTFSGHLLVCKNVLGRCGKDSLVLMDEIGSGTDPKQGVALAQSLLESMIEKGSKLVVTTHYYELKQFAVDDPRFTVAGMEFEAGFPTYKMVPNKISESYALAVAQRLKFPTTVIDRAEELLDEETRRMGNLLTELEEKKMEVILQQEQLRAKENEVMLVKQEVERIKDELENQRKTVRKEEAKKFTKKLDEKEKQIREMMENMKSNASKKSAVRSLGGIQSVKKDVLNAIDPSSKVQYDPLPPDELLNIGMDVMVSKEGQLYQKVGSIVKITPKFIEVSLGFMTQRMKREDLTLPVASTSLQSQGGRKSAIPKAVRRAANMMENDSKTVIDGGQSTSGTDVTIRTDANTLDLRGKNINTAKELSMNFFAKKLSSKTVFILHGHGEGGVLKNKLRSWLRSEKEFVRSFSPASAEDGGDAYTVVKLKSLF